MGFCLFNDVASLALHASAHHGLQWVAIIDFDMLGDCVILMPIYTGSKSLEVQRDFFSAAINMAWNFY